MDIETVRVKITHDGKVELKVEGIGGNRCLVVTEKLEKALGGVVLAREHTSEFYDETQAAEHLKVQG